MEDQSRDSAQETETTVESEFWGIVEHLLYLSLVGPLEFHLKMDPCPAIKLAQDVATDVVRQLRERLH